MAGPLPDPGDQPPGDDGAPLGASGGGLPDASTVMLLRDTADGLAVCMVERRRAGAFAGLLAFPGGKVDPADRTLPGSRWRGTAAHDGHAPMTARELGWQVAAVREAFEEVGVLLARRGDEPVTADHLRAPSFVAARHGLAQRGVAFDWTPWLAEEGLVLDLACLGAWSWWITPEGEPRRFDTRFYVAVVPEEQVDALVHDRVETVSARWMTVAQVEHERAEGRCGVIYPTRRNLRLLAPYATAAEALAAARGGHLDLRPVQPTLVERDGELVAHHPFDGSVEPVV